MLKLTDHEVVDLLHEDAHFLVYRGMASRGREPVLLRVPRDPVPDLSLLTRLRQEAALLAALHRAGTPGVPEPLALVDQGRSLLLAMRDPGGLTLAGQFRGRRMPLGGFFTLALATAGLLESLHAARVMHRGLHSSSLLYHGSSGDLCWLGLPLASRLQREQASTAPAPLLEGQLAYLAPEQTGRMNRPVDYRADFYALGVLFFELLAGELPFSSADPLETLHAHLAVTPPSPADLRPELPASVCSVVLKLLSKLAEDRYQTAAGLRADLLRCQAAWLAGTHAEQFELGTQDISGRFELPSHLYGREPELKTLLAAFNGLRSGGPGTLLLLRGPSGIGKSSLVAELHRPITAHRGHLATGKADQQGGGKPMAPLGQALSMLVQHLLGLPGEALARWKTRLLEDAGETAALVTELVPRLQLITGPVPPPALLPAAQARARLQRCLRRFIALFCEGEGHPHGQPLALFIDDLQWLDEACLAAWAGLAGLPHLLLVGAYRDSEVLSGHRLRDTLGALDRAGHAVVILPLAPLDVAHVEQLLGDALGGRHARHRLARLARQVHAKTGGNPFFTGQFIQALHRDGLITFDPATRLWQWNDQDLAGRNFTDNIVELMQHQADRLLLPARHALAVAGLLGHEFSARAFALAAPELAEAEGGTHALSPAVDLGLLARTPQGWRFLHDRAQEAAGAMTPTDDRRQAHWRIGCRLMEGLTAAELEDQRHAVAEHLNRGLPDQPGKTRRRQVVRLNRDAGVQALSAGMHHKALDHLSTGHALLSQADWAEEHALCFSLRLELARAYWLAGQLDVAENWLASLFGQAADEIEWAAAAQVNIELLMTRGESAAGYALVLQTLHRLGFSLPETPTLEQAQAAYEEHLALLADRPLDSLLELPPMTDPRCQAAVRLVATTHPVSYFTNGRALLMQLSLLASLTQRFGLTDSTAAGLAVFGFMVGAQLGDHRRAHELTRVASALVARPGGAARHLRATVAYHGALAGLWVSPIGEMMQGMQESLATAIDSGDRLTACMGAHRMVVDGLQRGGPLDALLATADVQLAYVREVQYAQGEACIILRRQQIQALRGKTTALRSLDGEGFTEAGFETTTGPTLAPVVSCWFHLACLAQRCLAGEHEAALVSARAAEPLYDSVAGLLGSVDLPYYEALSLAALHHQASPAEQAHLRARLAHHEQRLATWASLNAETFSHLHRLVSAEIARLEGEPLLAMRLYEQAGQQGLGARARSGRPAARAARAAAAFHRSRERRTLLG